MLAVARCHVHSGLVCVISGFIVSQVHGILKVSQVKANYHFDFSIQFPTSPLYENSLYSRVPKSFSKISTDSPRRLESLQCSKPLRFTQVCRCVHTVADATFPAYSLVSNPGRFLNNRTPANYCDDYNSSPNYYNSSGLSNVLNNSSDRAALPVSLRMKVVVHSNLNRKISISTRLINGQSTPLATVSIPTNPT